eukprot:m.216472 g.216472  ORF g.216472 m.216472 type:complete len:72 (-) comp15879_c0_seq1:1629-1844(-)
MPSPSKKGVVKLAPGDEQLDAFKASYLGTVPGQREPNEASINSAQLRLLKSNGYALLCTLTCKLFLCAGRK